MLPFVSTAICTLLLASVRSVRGDFAEVVYANDSTIQFTSGPWQLNPGGECTPVLWNGGVWSGGPVPELPYREAIVTNTKQLPLTFTITFTGTEFNVVGNDWRDGIVLFTLDGAQLPPYDLSSATNNTGARCRFPWFTRSGLAPISHTFTFSLTSPSPEVMTDSGALQPGAGLYYGLQFFYFSYTPLPKTLTSIAPSASATSSPTVSSKHKVNGAVIGIGVACVLAALAILALLLYFCIRRRRRTTPAGGSLDINDSPWNKVSSPMPSASLSSTGMPQLPHQQPSFVTNTWSPQPMIVPYGIQQQPQYGYGNEVVYGSLTPTPNLAGIGSHFPSSHTENSNSDGTRSFSDRASPAPIRDPAHTQSIGSLTEADVYRVVAETVRSLLPGPEGGGRPLPEAPAPPVYQSPSEEGRPT